MIIINSILFFIYLFVALIEFSWLNELSGKGFLAGCTRVILALFWPVELVIFCVIILFLYVKYGGIGK